MISLERPVGNENGWTLGVDFLWILSGPRRHPYLFLDTVSNSGTCALPSSYVTVKPSHVNRERVLV